MSSKERGFIPLTKAQSERVRFQVALPDFIDQDKIGVNLNQIHRLCQIGGISTLVVLGVEDQDISEATPQILGFNNQGSAYMGKASSSMVVPPSESISGSTRKDSPHIAQWAHSIIAVNMNEVRQRIENNKKWTDGIRSPKAWSYYLNRGIKDGISKEGTAQLLGIRGGKVDLAVFSTLVVLNSTGTAPFRYEPHVPSLPEAAGTYFTFSFIWNLWDRLVTRHPSLNDRDSRYTLFVGPEVDRAILLNILTKTSTLVKQIDKPTT